MIKFINPLKMSKWAYFRWGLLGVFIGTLITITVFNIHLPFYSSLPVGITLAELDIYLAYKQGRRLCPGIFISLGQIIIRKIIRKIREN